VSAKRWTYPVVGGALSTALGVAIKGNYAYFAYDTETLSWYPTK
jgi:hypothetical protein